MSEVKFCPSCGEARHPGDAFCRSCGRNLADDDERDEAGEVRTDPGPEPGTPPPAPATPSAPPPAPAGPPAVTQPMPPAAPTGYVVVPVSQPPPPPASPPVVAASPAATPAPGRSVAGLKGPVRPLALAGAAAIVVGVFLPWISGALGQGNGFDVPLSFLWSLQPTDGIKLGLVLLLVGAGAAALTFLPGTGPVRRILGVAAVASTVVYVIQLFRLIDQAGGSIGDVVDAIGVAVYVTLAGGALLASSK